MHANVTFRDIQSATIIADKQTIYRRQQMIYRIILDDLRTYIAENYGILMYNFV